LTAVNPMSRTCASFSLACGSAGLLVCESQ
jgi:hypothetical protein